jgi:hypothetical protein
MTIEEGIDYLVAKFSGNPNWQKLIRKSCTENPSAMRKNVNILNAAHVSRKVSAKAGASGEVNDVFQFLLQHGEYSAPFTPGSTAIPVATGMIHILFPLHDPILRLVDHAGRRIINVTLPRHVLFPGVIEVHVTARDGGTWVDVTGFGAGNFASANSFAGPLLFQEIIDGIGPARQKLKPRTIGR